MAGIKHQKQSGLIDDPNADIKPSDWNAEHFIDDTGIPIVKLAGHTKAVHDALAINADLLDGKDSTDFEEKGNKGVADGYASLGADGKVPSAQLPPSGGELETIARKTAD